MAKIGRTSELFNFGFRMFLSGRSLVMACQKTVCYWLDVKMEAWSFLDYTLYDESRRTQSRPKLRKEWALGSLRLRPLRFSLRLR